MAAHVRDGLAGGPAVLNGDVEGVGADKLLDCALYDPRGAPEVTELVVGQLVHHGNRSLAGHGQQTDCRTTALSSIYLWNHQNMAWYYWPKVYKCYTQSRGKECLISAVKRKDGSDFQDKFELQIFKKN